MMMTNAKKKQIRKYRQKKLNEKLFDAFLLNMIAIIIIMTIVGIINLCQNNKIDGENEMIANESDDHNAIDSPANGMPTYLIDVNLVDNVNNKNIENSEYDEFIANYDLNDYPVIQYSKDWGGEDSYLLAKIAMAEAEGESLETKVLILLTVLNRVNSEKFPNTIEEVIFQNSNGVYQFTPVSNGRWDNVEPNEECWKALRIVSELDYDISNGALFFEACNGDSWHSRNLEFICESSNTRFYK